MTDYFDIEYRKKCRKKLVEYLYEQLIRTNIPHPILAFVLKSGHFLISYIIILLAIFAPLPIGFVLTALSIVTFGMFNFFKGCFFSQLEYKLNDKDFINVIDPYLAVVGWEINDENRYSITMYIVYLYFALLFSILYMRMNNQTN
jgi:hypothetical protein